MRKSDLCEARSSLSTTTKFICQTGHGGCGVLHLLLLRLPLQLHPVGDHRDTPLHAAARLVRGDQERRYFLVIHSCTVLFTAHQGLGFCYIIRKELYCIQRFHNMFSNVCSATNFIAKLMRFTLRCFSLQEGK